MMDNTNNLTSTYCPADLPYGNLFDEIRHGLVISSIFFDLIAGAISSLFTYQIYRGVEISHPVYSVVFSNIMLANTLSFLTFMLIVVSYYTDCCVCHLLLEVFGSCVFFMNYICCAVVAFLRYHLLITTAKRDDIFYRGPEMTKIAKKALAYYWGLLILLCMGSNTLRFIMRTILPFTVKLLTVAWMSTLLAILSLTLITMVVYYRLDLQLENIRCLKSTNEGMKGTEGGDSGPIDPSGKKQRKTLSSSFTTKAQSITNVKDKSNEISSVLKNSSKQTPDRIARVDFQMSCTTDMSANLHSAPEKAYGGVYVGDVKISNNPILPNVMRSRDDVGHDTELDDVETPHNRKMIQSRSGYLSFYDSTLPNEIIPTEKCNLDSSTINGVSLKSYEQQEDTNPKINNLNPKHKDNDDDRIDVVQDWFEEHSQEPGDDKGQNKKGPEDKSSLEVNEYRNSKEHQSIKKALIVNSLFLGFCVVLSIFFSIIISKKSSKGSTILVLKSLFSLYRAFAPIVSSIYCFDVIRCLFQQIFETAVDALRNEYERARGLL